MQNHLLVNAVVAWVIAQILKTIIYAITNRELDIHRIVGDGGMPSSHSATVMALTCSAGLEYGFDSAAFAISAVLAIIVMHDACGVRMEAGRHAKALNELAALFASDMADEMKLKEFLGHTRLQVFFGALLGIVIAFLMQ